MFTYSQSTGIMNRLEVVVGHGYSGHANGRNNPAMQNVHNVGPIPQGEYTIGPPFTDPHKGPIVMHLTPNATNVMFGRDAFLIHGDNATNDASQGCIILGHTERAAISALLSVDSSLTVIA